MGEERRVVDPAEGVDAIGDATLRAVHRLEVAAEWIERAFGALLDAHHAAGHGQEMLLEAARLLDEAGHGDLAALVRSDAACKDAADGALDVPDRRRVPRQPAGPGAPRRGAGPRRADRRGPPPL